MEITLPLRTGDRPAPVLETPCKLVVIGANGAGKSRFGRVIERSRRGQTFRLSAVRALTLSPHADPPEVYSLTALYRTRKGLAGVPPCRLPTEFEQLLELLQEEAGGAVPGTGLFDRTQRVWETLFPGRRLSRKEGRLLVASADEPAPYNALQMSQGEKVVFYQMGAALYAPRQAVVFVEDPEMYLHPSVMEALWDEVERSRPDCSFIYLTHDIFFATGRAALPRVWVRSFDLRSGRFDYELLEGNRSLPEETYLALLGSRKPVLFIEGNDTGSIDGQLYPLVFPDYTVKPLGGCDKVIEVTRVFGEMRSFHHLESRGIVDRDRRTFHEVMALRERHIFVPYVAEVENFLLLEAVIRILARRQGLNDGALFREVERNLLSLFRRDLGDQALLHTRHRIRRQLEYKIDRRFESIDAFAEHIEMLTQEVDPRGLFRKMTGKFRSYVENREYREVLRVYNRKSLIVECGLLQAFGLNRKEEYLELLLTALRGENPDAEALRTAIRACFDWE